MSEARVFRSRSTRGFAVVFTLMLILLFSEGARRLIGGQNKSADVTAGGAVLMFAALVGLAWIWFFFAQMGVITSPKGIVIRNWFRRRAIPWDDIQSFRFGNGIDNLTTMEELSAPVLQTFAVLKNGRHQIMGGLSATRINRSESIRRVQELLDQMDGERLRYTARLDKFSS